LDDIFDNYIEATDSIVQRIAFNPATCTKVCKKGLIFL